MVDELMLVGADEDFLEHLAEMSFIETIDVAELNEEWSSWCKENCE